MVPDLSNGRLPFGRWACSVGEVEERYVPDDPMDVRRRIWTHWEGLTSDLRAVVGEIAAAWLSGSFFSDKNVPGDLDCVYVIDTQRLDVVRSRGDLQELAFVHAAATGQIKPRLQVPVDSYILEWMPTPGHVPVAGAGNYLGLRGYWDDLWTRVKDDDARLDSIPRRDYLEVMIDGYR